MSFTVEQHIAAAWVLDRADRYPNDSPVRAALDEIMAGLANGEHLRAAEHGELDDMLRVPFIRVAEDAQTAAFVAWLRGGKQRSWSKRAIQSSAKRRITLCSKLAQSAKPLMPTKPTRRRKRHDQGQRRERAAHRRPG